MQAHRRNAADHSPIRLSSLQIFQAYNRIGKLKKWSPKSMLLVFVKMLCSEE